ncbi:hypothetical protein D3C71_2174770 [compost metagenome]
MVSEELARGELTQLPLIQQPPSLELVVAWQTGVELVDEVVQLCRNVLERYARDAGPQRIVLV